MSASGHGHTRDMLRRFKQLVADKKLHEDSWAYHRTISCNACGVRWTRIDSEGRRGTVRDRISAVVHVDVDHPAESSVEQPAAVLGAGPR